MKKIKKEFKWMEPVEFEKYQEYLRERHKEGWKFVKKGSVYHYFEACEPEDYLYEIDASKEMTLKEKEAYFGMYQEFGYEFATQAGRFYYFRKKAKAGEESFAGRENGEEKFEKVKRMKEFYDNHLIYIVLLLSINVFPATQATLSPDLYDKVWGMGIMLIAALGITPATRSYLKFRSVYKQYKYR